MSLENRVTQVETDMNDVKVLLASMARHVESATAIAEQNAIAIADHRQDMALIDQRLDRVSLQTEATRQQLDQHMANSEATRQQLFQASQRLNETNQQLTHTSQRLDEFIYQSQRLLTNQGDRLSRSDRPLE